jgi:hypothetical protein
MVLKSKNPERIVKPSRPAAFYPFAAFTYSAQPKALVQLQF